MQNTDFPFRLNPSLLRKLKTSLPIPILIVLGLVFSGVQAQTLPYMDYTAVVRKNRLIFLLFLLFLPFLAQAQDVDLTFNENQSDPGVSMGSNVWTLALQPDGKILIGGGFTSYNGTGRARIARLNSDGSLDTSFNPGEGANSTVNTLALQPDGKILIGGVFTSYNGTGRVRIARLNSDGSLDTSFDPGTGANNTVNTFALQPDGKILIGGSFISYNGTGRGRIARLNADGSLDTSFNPGTGTNEQVRTLALQPDGKILIGGDFTTYNGIGRSRIARLNSDGSLDDTFNPGTGASFSVLTLALQPDGKILIGGTFTSYNGTGRARIARLNSDGTLDTSFDPGTGANNPVYSLALQRDGDILIGGIFSSLNGTRSMRIARLNSDGSLDTSFNPDAGPNGQVLTLALQPDGKILIGGSFTSFNNVSRFGVARVLQDSFRLLINSIEVLTNSSAKVTANVGDPGDRAISERGIIYVDSLVTMMPVLETSGVIKLVNGTAQSGDFETTLSGLSPDKSYAVRAYAKTSNGQIFYSEAIGVSTNTAPAFDHSLSDGVLELDISENSTAVLDIFATDPDQGQTLAFTLQGTDAALFEVDQATRKLSFKTAQDFEDPQDQNKDNVYEFAVIATDNALLPKSSKLLIQVRVTNVAEIPVIQNQAITDIGSTGANFNARIIHNGGGGAISASGFVLSSNSVNSNPQIGGLGVSAFSAVVTQGDFSKLATGLEPNTFYSYRAYATNESGTAYSEVATFTTLTTAAAPPVFGYAPALLKEINKPISAIQAEILGSAVSGDQTYAEVSTFSTNVSGPRGMVMDALGNLYVAETGGKRISKFAPDGTKSIIHQFGSFEPVDITIDSSTGDLYFTIAAHRIIWFPNGNKANYPAQEPTYAWTNESTNVFAGSSTSGTTNATGTSARFNAPAGIAMSPDNTYLLVAENGSHRIRRIDVSTRAVTTFAGSTSSGTADGDRSTTARFNNPEGVHFAQDGSIYVTEWNATNHRIRKISGDQVSTLAGSTSGLVDGLGASARFERPRGITTDALGNIFVVEGNNNVVRRISPEGEVGVLSGSLRGGYDNTKGTTDGVAFAARFDAPQGAYFAPDGYLYVSDNVGNRIRKISLSGWELLTPLPEGLSFDGSTAEISGTPTDFAFEPHYFSAFDSNTLDNDSKGASPVLTGAAEVRSGFLQLTPLSNFQTGGLHIPGKGIKEGSLRVDFRVLTTKTSSSGNGISYSFAKDINSTTSGMPEVGIGSGLSLAFNTLFGGIRLYYGPSKFHSNVVGSGGLIAVNNDNSWRGKSAQVSLEVSYEGKVNVWLEGTLVFKDIQLPASYLQEDFSTWNHGFRASTGTTNDLHAIDNVSIAQGYGTGSYWVSASNGLGTHSSSLELSVVTLPAVNTLAVSEISSNSAKVSFRTVFNGGDQLQKQGVIWGTSSNLTLDNALGRIEENLVQTDIISLIQGLSNSEKYYVRAFIKNDLGTYYANELTFVTPDAPTSITYQGKISLKLNNLAKITPQVQGPEIPKQFSNQVSTVAGSTEGFQDGQGESAKFHAPSGIVTDNLGNIYVSDAINHKIRKIDASGNVLTFAGMAGISIGFADGQPDNARFWDPNGLAFDRFGNLYVADKNNHRIRKINTNGLVTTLAGSSAGLADDQGSNAKFDSPVGVSVDSSLNVYVADQFNHRIRKIQLDGNVSTLAGSTSGFADGSGLNAKFNFPSGVATDRFGNVYVAEGLKLRKIDKNGEVTTLLENVPVNGIALDPSGTIYFTSANSVKKINAQGEVINVAGENRGFLDGLGTNAEFDSPLGITVDVYGNAFVADRQNNKIRKIDLKGWSISPELPKGLVLHTDGSISGTPTELSPARTYTVTAVNSSGSTSYSGSSSFSFELAVQEVGLSDLKVSSGSLNTTFNPDESNYNVFVDASVSSIGFTATELFEGSTIQWKLGDGSFTEVASGTASPEISLQEGQNTITIEVRDGDAFKTYTLTVNKPVTPPAIAYVKSLTLPLGEAMNPQLPQNSGGVVPSVLFSYSNRSSFAGSLVGFAEGQGVNAQFGSVYSIVFDKLGNLYVADYGNHRIRKIDTQGNVTTFAGSTQGFADGPATSAKFSSPSGLAFDKSGNLYVADYLNDRIRKIDTFGNVTTFAGSTEGFADGLGSNAKFNRPFNLAFDGLGNLYVTEFVGDKIRKIDQSGNVTTIAGSDRGLADGPGISAMFDRPAGIALDTLGNAYIADFFNSLIRKIDIFGNVTTFAGSVRGFADGQRSNAKFAGPFGLTFDNIGNLYVADQANGRVRKIDTEGNVSTVVLGNRVSAVTIDDSGDIYFATNEIKSERGADGKVTSKTYSIIEKISGEGWSVSPTLPAGLVLNQDGSISGTPTVLSPSKDYVVTARNGGGASSYTIRIEVTAGATEGLRNLELSQGTLNPVFSSTTFSYGVQVRSSVESLSFTPTAVNPNATLTLNGANVVNATATNAYPLNFGPNTFTFLVKETDNTEKTYTVVVTRALAKTQNEILWEGTNGKQWSVGGNWTGNKRPDTGADVKFSPTAVNDLEVDEDLIAGTIDFNGSDKRVVLVNHDLTVSGFATRGASNYVEMTGSGRLKASISTNLKFLYPVGMTTFSPVSITNKTGAAVEFSVGLSGEVYDQGTSGNAIPNARIKRTWDIGNPSSSVGGSGIDLEFTWTATDDSGVKNPALYHFENGAWVKLDAAKTTVDLASRILIYSGYTGSLSPFAIYDELPTETQLTVSTPTLTKTKVYDGTKTVQVTAGTLSGVSADDVVTVTATAEYDNANAGTGKTIRVTYTLDGADAAKYLKPVDEVYTDGEITKIQLTATAATLTTSKEYDGTVKATVEAGTLQGVLTDETVNLFASAAYETAEAGNSKKITVSYTIDGSDAVNYLAPVNEEVTTGEITPATLTVTIKSDAKFVGQTDAAGFNGADISGFVGGEDESALSGTLAISRSNSSVNSAGDYPGVLVGSGYTSGNYSITYVDGDYSILPADALLVKLETSKPIYGTNPDYTLISAGYYSDTEQQLVDLTDQTTINGNEVLVFDGIDQIRFELDISNPLLSTSGNLKAGSYTVAFANEQLSSNVNSLKVIGQVEVAHLALQATVTTGEFKEYDGTPAMIGVEVEAFGLLDGDELTLSPGTGTFQGSSAGNQGYTISGLSLSGADAGNYTLDSELSGQGQISPKALTVTGTTVSKVKEYDGNESATATLGTVSGQVGKDQVEVIASAQYSDKFAGENKPITVSYTLEGNAAANYTAPSSESLLDGEITRKALTITDPVVVLRKEYDGTREASVQAGSLLGLISGDNVTVTASAQYDDASVGTGKTITVRYSLSGSDTLNYQTTLQEFETDKGEIYATGPVQLLITEPNLTLTKEYDQNATAAVVAGTLIGLAQNADVTVTAAASYENATIGTNKKITVIYTLSGPDSDDYLAPPNYVVSTGEIKPVQLTITDPKVTLSKIFDGTTSATVESLGTVKGILSNDDVVVEADATYEDAEIGTGKKITVTYTLTGTASANYRAPEDFVFTTGEIKDAIVDLDGDGIPDNEDPDTDGDGIDNTIEQEVPSSNGTGKGDGNGDGIPDYLQPHVVSFVSAETGIRGAEQYVTLATPAGNYKFSEVVSEKKPAGLARSVSSRLPFGVTKFTLSGLTTGEEVSLNVLVQKTTALTGYFKQASGQTSWTNLIVGGVSTTENKKSLSFKISDNGVYDLDSESGVLKDPGLITAYPMIFSNGGDEIAEFEVKENQLAVTTVEASDLESSTFTFGIEDGVDQALFEIDANTGVLTFKDTPDFENPGDADQDNVYELIVNAFASNGTIDRQWLYVTVVDDNDRPTFQTPDGGVALLRPLIEFEDEDSASSTDENPGDDMLGIGLNGEFTLDLYSLFEDQDQGEGNTMVGIAISENPADPDTEGVWEYSTDLDVLVWYPIGAVSLDNALLLDLEAYLRFVPAPNFFGTPKGLKVHPVDGSGATVVPEINSAGGTAWTFDSDKKYYTDLKDDAPNSSVGILAIEVGIKVEGTEDLPEAKEVSVTGTAQVESELTGNYTFVDLDGDSESGTQLAWYRSESGNEGSWKEISGATSKNYTLTLDDLGQYIRFGVRPNDGKAFGDWAYAEKVGPIAPNGIAISDSDYFITIWDLSKQETVNKEISFYSSNSTGSITYSWQVLPDGETGTGTFEEGSNFLRTIPDLPENAMIRLKIAPTHLERFFTWEWTAKGLVDVEQWGTASWTSMESAFKDAESLMVSAIDLPDLTNVTNLSAMFEGCKLLNGPANINNWNTENVTNMSRMFAHASSFNGDISSWNTANVTTMSNMFFGAATFNQDISNWKTENLIFTVGMFRDATVFNQDISQWNTANVRSMAFMFRGAVAFNQNISNWNIANVSSMRNMFQEATAFNQNLGAWSLNSEVDLSNMLNNSGIDCANYSAALMGWAENNPTVAGRSLGAEGLTYGTNAASARNTLVTDRGWTITGDTAGTSVCLDAAVPQAPTSLTVTEGDGEIEIRFTVGDDGGSAITNYEYSLDGGQNWVAFDPAVTDSPVTISELGNGTEYGITLRAVNAIGAGASSEMVKGTPRRPLSSTGIVIQPVSSLSYTGEALEPVLNIQDGDKVLISGTDYTLSYSDNLNVGSATVEITGIGNYSGEISSGFDILPLDLTITVDAGLKKTYGEQDPELTYTHAGTVAGETPSFEGKLSRSAGENVGEYDITLGSLSLKDNGSFKAGNYSLKLQSGAKLAIEKAKLTVKVNNDSKFVTQTDASGYAGVSYEGFVFGEDKSVLEDESLSIIRINSSVEQAGSYPGVLEASGLVSSNYEFEYVNGDYTIIAADRLLVKLKEIKVDYGKSALPEVESASYLSSTGQQVVDLTSSTTVNGVTVTVVDGSSGQASFTIAVKDAVSNISSAGSLNAGNYTLEIENLVVSSSNFNNTVVLQGFMEVKPIALTATLTSSTEKVYDGNDLMLDLSMNLNTPLSGDLVTVTGTGNYSDKNVGTPSYVVSGLVLSGKDSKNYFLSGGAKATLTGTGEITSKALSVTPKDNQSKNFGQQDPILEYIWSGQVSGELPQFTGELERAPGEIVGSYGISLGSLALSDNGSFLADNYTIDLTGGKLFEIKKAKVTITADDKQKTYGEANPELTFTYQGLVNGDTQVKTEPSIKTTATESSIAGTYPITLTGGEDDNYEIELKDGTLTVGKAKVTITADDKQKTYGEANPELTFTYQGLVNGDTQVKTEPSIKTTATESSIVGTYPITLTGGADDNYEIELKDGSLIVGKAKVTITADNKEKVYGASNPELTFAYQGLVNGDTQLKTEPSIKTTATESSITGTYPITLTGGADDNYEIELKDGTLTVSKAKVTITADNKQKVYGEANPELTFTYQGLVNGDKQIETEPSIATTATASSNTGTYPITLEGGSDDNYEITLKAGTLTIGKKGLTITADDKQKVYGEANPTLTFTYTGLVNGDTKVATEPSISTTATASSNVGTYPITLSGGEDQNYSITLEAGTLTIGKKALTITADDKQKTYGEANPPLTFTYSGLVNGDTKVATEPSINTTATASSNVGTYPIELTGGSDANYDIELKDGTLTVGKAKVTITADNKQRAFGTENPELTFTYSGLVNGDTKVATEPSINTTATASSNVGTYPIELTGGSDANYDIELKDGTLTVGKAKVTITADDKQKIYGEANPALTFTYSGLVNGDTKVATEPSISTTATASSNVGTYPITLSGGEDQNYAITLINGTLTIGKKALMITADDKQKTYGEANPPLTFTYSGLVNGDTKVTTEPSITTTATASSNVGTYPISLSGGEDQNYAITLVNGTLTIGKKDLTITADDKQKTYGEENPALTFTYTGLVNGDTKVVTEPSISTTATASSNVGTYPITLSGGEDQNYAITLVNGTLTIGKKALTITADDKQKIYGEANPPLTFTYSGLVNGDTKVTTEPSIATMATVSSNVGTYPITLTGGSDDNYEITLAAGTLTIGKKAVTITADDQQKTYGEANPTLTFTYTGLVNGDEKTSIEPTISTTATASSNTGTYPITLEGGSDDNYEITLEAGTLTIGKKAVTITADDQQKTYGEANPTLTFSYTGLTNGDTKVSTEPTISTTATASSITGTYPITLTGGSDDNYVITLAAGTLTIGKKAVTITADDQQKTYGEANPTLTFSYTGLTNGDTKVTTEPSIATTATQSSVVGIYPITLTGGSDDNYEITLAAGTLTIGKKAVTITADDQQKTYGEANPTLTFTYTGLVNGDEKTSIEPTISTTATASSNTGTYPITLEGGSDDNYEITLEAGTLTIGQKALTITADDKQKIYGEANPALTFTYSGLVNGDTKVATEPSIATMATVSSNVGTYPITLAGGADQNYAITLVNGTLTIGKKDLTITADSKQKIYGEANPVLTFTYSGLVNGDTKVSTEPSVTTSATANSNVGTYPITLAGGSDQNYAITLVNGTLTIGKKDLTITADDKQKIYGEANPALTFTYSGLVNGDTKVSTEPSVATSATANSNVGTYPITLAGGSDQNYAITLVNGTLTIGKKDLTITADSKQKIYGEANPALTFTYAGLVNGDTKVSTEPSVATSATANSNVGTYPITLSGGEDQNYVITLINGTLTIGQKALTITADNKQKIYGEANPTLTFTYTGLVNGDTKVTTEPSIATMATSSSNVGTYPITLSGGEDQNYAITLINGTLTIGQKALTITADNKQKIYGEANPALTFTYSGLVNGDTKVTTEPSIATTATSSSNVGTYPITLSGGEDQNYAITLINGTLTIGQKALTITADNKQKIYGEANPALTFTYSGLVNGDTKVTTEPSITTMATVSSNVGTYPITLTGGSDQNYTITLVEGKLEIVPAVLRVTADNKTKVFGKADPGFTYQVSGLKGTDTESEVLSGTLSRTAGEVPGVYAITQGTLKQNTNYVLAFTDGSLEIVAARILAVTELGVVQTQWGKDPILPSKVTVLTTDGQLFEVGVTWNTFGLNTFKRGTYTIKGTFNLPSGIENPDEVLITVTITVAPKPAPTDVNLSNSTFNGSVDTFFLEVGSFQITDPIDNIHLVTLLGDGYDNKYFEIKDNVLFWSSADRAEGKTEFTIVVRVTDRDGNTLDKMFTIVRTRPEIQSIVVENTFTPDGDGFNDTWGVPEIRFFSGARVQVFERSGERVFYTENPDVRWDGTFNGKELPVGTYYWVLELRETGETRRGLLNLLRK